VECLALLGKISSAGVIIRSAKLLLWSFKLYLLHF
jgi:hypothetical protein